MANDATLTGRAWQRFRSIGALLVVGGLMLWGYARAGLMQPRPFGTVATVAPNVPEKRTTTADGDADVRGLPASAAPPASGRLIETLRQQVAQSPLLGDADAQSSLLEALDQAGTVWTRTQRQNRDALRQLKRQVRIGESRQSPHLILVTFDHAVMSDATTSSSPRGKLFTELAERGVSFQQHYAGGESPTSGWWTLMTGRNTGRARSGDTRFQLRNAEPNLASSLWQAGYATGFIGVWHDHIPPLDTGFDEATGWQGTSDTAPLFPKSLFTARTKMSIRANDVEQPSASLWQLLSTEIASFLTDHATATRPFFLHVRLPDLTATTTLPPGESAESVVRQLFENLKKAGIDQRTRVFVTALTGTESTAAPLLTESVLRVPLVMVGDARLAAGTTVSEATAAWDVLPTLLDLAQATRRATATDGRSLLPLTQTQSSHSERLLYWESDDAGRAQSVRLGEWKGMAKAGDRQLRLYHLPTDHAEEKDVAADHPDVVKRLLAPPASSKAAAAASSSSDPI